MSSSLRFPPARMIRAFAFVLLLLPCALVAQSPQPHLTGIPGVPASITLGSSFTFTVNGTNSGTGPSNDGAINVSFPDLGAPGDSARVNATQSGFDGAPKICDAGTITCLHARTTGNFITTLYVAVEGDSGNWVVNAAKSLTITVTPKAVGSFRIYYRESMSVPPGFTTYKGDPASGPTDQQGWWIASTSVTVLPPTGNLSVTVRNVDNSARSGATCKLYDATGHYLNLDRTSDANGICSWTSLNTGTYNAEAYSNGASPLAGTEYWGNVGATVNQGVTTTATLSRIEPYASQVEMRLGSSSGQLLGPGSTINAGQTVWIGVKVLQKSTTSRTSTAQVVLDRSQDSAFDYDTGESSQQTVPVGSTPTTFAFTVTPAAAGTYFFAVRIRTSEFAGWTKTDGWNWTPTFTVQAPLADLEVTLLTVTPLTVTAGGFITGSFTVGNAGGANAGIMTHEVWLSRNSDGTDPSTTSGDVKLGSISSPGIPAGSIAGFGPTPYLLDQATPAGSYFVKVRANAGNVVAEATYGNNVGVSQPIGVGNFGTTVIAHGFQLFDTDSIQWACDLAEAVVGRAHAGQILFYDKLSGRFLDYAQLPAGSTLRSSCRQPAFAGPANGENVIVFDWIIESNNPYQGYTEAAGAALFSALMDPANAQSVNFDHLHLIGHSRGAVVNSEAAERLIAAGKPAPERVTMLDPVDDHVGYSDLDVNAGKPYSSQGVVAWASGSTAYETYFETNTVGTIYPWGHAIPGSTNLDLTDAFQGSLCSAAQCPLIINQHSWPHSWYHFTVNQQANANNVPDGEYLSPGWFGATARNCAGSPQTRPGARASEGFAYSRLGGGAVQCPKDGQTTSVLFDFSSAKEGIVNGDFSRGDAGVNLPGWKQHGGGGAGVIGGLGDRFLALDSSAPSRVHDRVYVPLTAQQLEFMMRVTTPDPDDILQVSLGGQAFTTGVSYAVDFHKAFVTIPSGLRGQVITIGFSLLSQGGSSSARVDVDNVHFNLTGNPAQPYVLSVAAAGTGDGRITSSVAGIDCGSHCRAGYSNGQVVTLAAAASPSSVFAGWSGDADCFDASVTMTGDRSCVATFNLNPGTYTLTVSGAGSGSGTINSNPLGINCGTDCSQGFTTGTMVTLFAQANSGSVFSGWTGDPDCSDGLVTMNVNHSCTAIFERKLTLSITKAGTGSGRVTSSPGGLDCGAYCAAAYLSGTAVTLTASPTNGSSFAGWSGDGDCSDGVVTMGADHACTATFTVAAGAGLGVRYAFDEGSGTTALDTVGVPDNGAIAGATYVAGHSGTALRFVNVGDRVTVPQTFYSGFGNTAYFEAWIRPSAYPAPGHLGTIFRKRGDFNDWEIDLKPDGSLNTVLYKFDHIGSAAAAGGQVPLSTWTKVVTWYDGGALRLFLNGVQVGAMAAAFPLDWPGNYWTTEIGNDTRDGLIYNFAGDIDEVYIGTAPPPAGASDPLDYFTITPCRVLDTRSASRLRSGEPRTFQMTGAGGCGVPAAAKALAVNLTVVGPTAKGNVALWPADIAKPTVSAINFAPGETRANNAIVSLATDGLGDIGAQAFLTDGGTVDLLVDIAGYFATGVQVAPATCSLDPGCYAGNTSSVRDVTTGQCVPTSACTAVWKCAEGAVTGSCGGGSQDCAFSPGCPQGEQDCLHGFCSDLASCTDRIKFAGYSTTPTPNQCSCAGHAPADGSGCP